MSDIVRLEMLVQLGLKYNQEEEPTDTEYAIFCAASEREQICATWLATLLKELYRTSPQAQSEDILTWYQQSVDFQDMTRILSGLLSKRGESDG